jgi:hypothetical protein
MTENLNKIESKTYEFAIDFAQRAFKFSFEETLKYRKALAIIKDIIDSPTNKDDLNHKINCIYLICSEALENRK